MKKAFIIFGMFCLLMFSGKKSYALDCDSAAGSLVNLHTFGLVCGAEGAGLESDDNGPLKIKTYAVCYPEKNLPQACTSQLNLLKNLISCFDEKRKNNPYQNYLKKKVVSESCVEFSGYGDGGVSAVKDILTLQCSPKSIDYVESYLDSFCNGQYQPKCGNNILDEGETCDGSKVNGVILPGYKCSKECQIVPSCGDGEKDADETCDSGSKNGQAGYCNNTCTGKIPENKGVFPSAGQICGDGIVNGTEECDDHNTIDGDGCSKDCQFETDLFQQKGKAFCHVDLDGNDSCHKAQAECVTQYIECMKKELSFPKCEQAQQNFSDYIQDGLCSSDHEETPPPLNGTGNISFPNPPSVPDVQMSGGTAGCSLGLGASSDSGFCQMFLFLLGAFPFGLLRGRKGK